MAVVYDEAQHKLLKHVFPPKDLAISQKRKYLLRMAVIISASYAYYRQLLPPEAFKRKLLYQHEIHLFNSDHPVGSKEKQAFTNLEGPVCNGEIKEIYFAACEEPNARTVVEALKFEFFYSQNVMVAQFPNSTHIRVGDIMNFATDFETMIYRVRTVCSVLKDFGRTMIAGVMCTFTSRRASIDPITGYNVENFDDVTRNLESLPIGYIPLFDDETGAMGIRLMTRYLEEPPEDVFKDVELQVQYRDRWPPSSALSSNEDNETQTQGNNNGGNYDISSRYRAAGPLDADESTILGGRISVVERSKQSDSVIVLEREEPCEEHARTAEEYPENYDNPDSPLLADSLLDFKEHSMDLSPNPEDLTSSQSGDSDDGHDGGAGKIQKEQTPVMLNEQTEELTSIRKRSYFPFEELPSKRPKQMKYVLMESEKVSELTIDINESGQVLRRFVARNVAPCLVALTLATSLETALRLAFLFLVLADVLEDTCKAYNGVVPSVNTAYFDGQCTQVFRIIGEKPTDSIAMCDDTMSRIKASCQLLSYSSNDEMEKLVTRNLINSSYVFFLGISRISCRSSWAWTFYNGTVTPYSGNLTLSEPNTECENDIVAYNRGIIAPAQTTSLNTSAFVCQCYMNSKSSGSTMLWNNSITPQLSNTVTDVSSNALMTTKSTVPTESDLTSKKDPNSGSNSISIFAQFLFLIIILH